MTWPPPRWRRLASKAGWNLIDQGLLSLTNLALALMVANSVDAAAFGAFSLCFTVYSMTIVCSRNLASEPVVIRFSDKGAAAIRAVASRSAGTAAAIGSAVGLGSAGVGLVLGGVTSQSLLAMGLVLPALLVQDAWRFVFFAQGRPWLAAASDATWSALQLVSVFLLMAADTNSAALFVLAWGLSGGAAAALGALRAEALPRVTAARRWIAEHWDLTGFMLFEALLLLGAYNGVVFYIAGHGELAGVGALRAAQVVNGPIQLLTASVFAFAVPELVRRPHLRDRHPLLVAGSIGASVAAAAALWNGALFLIPPEIGERLLGDSWTGMREVLPAVALGAIGNVIAVGPAVVTYAIGDSRTAFRIHFGVAALIVVGGGAGYHLDGVVGMALGVALAYWLPLPAWYLSLRSHRRFLQAAGTQPAG